MRSCSEVDKFGPLNELWAGQVEDPAGKGEVFGYAAVFDGHGERPATIG